MSLRARIELVERRLPAAVHGARLEWAERSYALLRLEDAQGRVGWGEASPLPGYSPDTLEAAASALASLPFDAVSLDDVRAPAECVADLLALVPASLPSARCAVETALLDLLGLRRGQPAHRLLGGTRATPLPLAALLSGDDATLVLAEARSWTRLGVRTLKLKVGADPERALTLGRALRDAFGPTLGLRFDANGGLPVSDAPRLLAEFASLGPELFEEPVPFDALPTCADTGVPLALDESLQGPHGDHRLARALDAGLVRAIVLKPMALGGALRCLDLARKAHAREVGAVVTHLFDGPVARAAAGALALALPAALPAGLASHRGLAAFPSIALPMFTDAELLPTERPGLGLEAVELGT